MKTFISISLLAAVLASSACSALRNDGANSTIDIKTPGTAAAGDPNTLAPEAGGAAGVVSTANRSGTNGRPTDGTVVTGATPSGTNNGNFNSTPRPAPMGTANTTSSGVPGETPVSADAELTVNDARQFMQQALISGVTELQLSKIAGKDATRPAVKAFAAMMISEHGRSNAELKKLATQNKISIPSQEAIEGTADLREKKEKLMKADSEFDNIYLDIMIQDHMTAIKLFEQATASTSPVVKAFATKMLPALKAHLDKAKSLNR